jgi:hypothetical protein
MKNRHQLISLVKLFEVLYHFFLFIYGVVGTTGPVVKFPAGISKVRILCPYRSNGHDEW